MAVALLAKLGATFFLIRAQAKYRVVVDPPEIQWNQVIDELRELRYILYSPEVSIKDLKE